MVDARGQWCGSSGFLVRGDCRNPDGCSCDQISALCAELEQVKQEYELLRTAQGGEYADTWKVRAEAAERELEKLSRYFRDEAAGDGFEGDVEGWSPVDTAITVMRRKRAAVRLAGARVVTDEAADAPRCWWINHGNYGQITQREDEAAFAKSEGKRVIEYCPKPLLSALAEPAGEAEPRQFLPTEDGEFNGNVEPVDDRIPIAATEARQVDWVDVTGWVVFKGHAIPVDVARYIAEKINLYAEHRATPPDASAIREALERLLAIAEKQKAYHNTKQHEFPSIEQCVDEDGKFSPASNLYELLQGETYNGRYTEADWWVCTIRAEIAALAGAKP